MDSIRREPSDLAAALVAQSPILAAARERRIAPRPAGGLQYGVFKPVLGRDLKDVRRLVAWHRQQLSAALPVMGDTEADLLLTIASALYARSLPANEVQKTRVAVFASTIILKRWEQGVPFVPQARVLLDDAIRQFGPAWAGLADETAEVLAEKARAET
jgi:hypothetical protein